MILTFVLSKMSKTLCHTQVKFKGYSWAQARIYSEGES